MDQGVENHFVEKQEDYSDDSDMSDEEYYNWEYGESSF